MVNERHGRAPIEPASEGGTTGDMRTLKPASGNQGQVARLDPRQSCVVVK